MATYTRDKKYREVQTEIRKKERKKDKEEPSVGGEYVDTYRNISVAATGEKDRVQTKSKFYLNKT